MEIGDNRQPKRPAGWMKPYWAKAGSYAVIVPVSFFVSLLVVGFGCGILLQAAIPAEPIVWRVVEAVLNLLICVGVTLYLAVREGYNKRRSSCKADVIGGLLFVLMQTLVALPLGTVYIVGTLPWSVASLIYFGNQPMFVSELDAAPMLLTLLCMVAAVPLVYIPAMMWGTRRGARLYQREIDELKEDHEKRK